MNNFLVGTIVTGTAAGLALDITRRVGWKISPCIDRLQAKKVMGNNVPFTVVGVFLGLATGIVADSGVMNVIGSVLKHHPRSATSVLLPAVLYFAWDKIPG